MVSIHLHTSIDDILQETEELIKIFVMSIETAEKKPRIGMVEYSVSGVCFFIRCWNNLRSGATSLFDVGRSSFNMFDVHLWYAFPRWSMETRKKRLTLFAF